MNRETLRQVGMFAVSGVIGYVVDVAVLHVAAPFAGPYGGRVISYFAAATTTFLMNRRFTFGVRGREKFFKQWGAFLLANLSGGAVNYTIYALLTAFAPAPANHPFLAVAAGSLSGMAINFTLSKRVVFRA